MGRHRRRGPSKVQPVQINVEKLVAKNTEQTSQYYNARSALAVLHDDLRLI
jgi:hypothetical protein